MSADPVAEVSAAADDYDDALATGATDRATGWFEPLASSSRFGPEGEQWGIDEVASVRAATAPTGVAVVRSADVRPVADDLVLHLKVIERGGKVIQRTQLWKRTADGWRIVHAHVSPRGSA